MNFFEEPFRMVFVGILSSIVLSASLIFYRYVYPKKNINLFYLLILISILPLISILRPGAYDSGDLVPHVKISMMFYRMLEYGEIVPQWSDISCGGYGCPYFLFIYTFPYYFISLFHLWGLTFIASVKLFLAIVFIFSGISMYLWIKDELGSKAGFIAGIFYLFAPYHLVDLHFRNAIGEMAAFAILPLCFWFTRKIIISRNVKWIIFNSFSIFFLMLSHLTALVIAIPLIVLYGAFLKKRGKIRLLPLLLSILLAFMLGSFYWIPILTEGKFVLWGANSQITLYPVEDLLYSPWRFGFLFQGPEGQLSHLIGYSHLAIIAFSIFLLVVHAKSIKENRNRLMLFLALFLGIAFMITNLSSSIWNSVNILKSFQFSYRLLIFCALLASLIAGLVLRHINNKLIILICSITVIMTVLNWGNRKADPRITDEKIMHQILNTDFGYAELTSPIWINDNQIYKKHKPQNKQIEIISGQADILSEDIRPGLHKYRVRILEDADLKDNTFFFPGWSVYLDNHQIPVNYQNSKYPGVIIFKLKKGIHDITVVFEDTLVRRTGKIISLATLLSILFFIFLNKKPKKFISTS